MILYWIGFVIAAVVWFGATSSAYTDAIDNPQDKKKATRARVLMLAFFLIPLYPAVACVALVVVPIIKYRQLGRLTKENE